MLRKEHGKKYDIKVNSGIQMKALWFCGVELMNKCMEVKTQVWMKGLKYKLEGIYLSHLGCLGVNKSMNG